jgi:hypothetical protein
MEIKIKRQYRDENASHKMATLPGEGIHAQLHTVSITMSSSRQQEKENDLSSLSRQQGKVKEQNEMPKVFKNTHNKARGGKYWQLIDLVVPLGNQLTLIHIYLSKVLDLSVSFRSNSL